jgi:hypothetical protein
MEITLKFHSCFRALDRRSWPLAQMLLFFCVRLDAVLSRDAIFVGCRRSVEQEQDESSSV